MAGRDAVRGFIYQGIIAVLECVLSKEWDGIRVEPETENDKIDIILSKDGKVIKAIQVKSSINKFELPEICKWLKNIVEDTKSVRYELVLIGDTTEPARKIINRINSNDIIKNSKLLKLSDSIADSLSDNCSVVQVKQMFFCEEQLWKRLKQELLEFIEQSYDDYYINNEKLELLSNIYLANVMKIGTKGKVYTKEDFISELVKIMNSAKDNNRIAFNINNILRKIVGIVFVSIAIILSWNVMIQSPIKVISIVCLWVICITSYILLQKSNNYFKEVVAERNYDTNKSKDCYLLEVIIHKDNILSKQEIVIKNILLEEIKLIRGNLKFYNYDKKVHQIEFEKSGIGVKREETIDLLKSKLTKDYYQKTHWNEVELEISEMTMTSGKKYTWKGIIIRLIYTHFAILNYYNYWHIFGKRIPYEVTWLSRKVPEAFDIIMNILKTKRMCYGKFSLSKKIKSWTALQIQKITFCIVLLSLLMISVFGISGVYFIFKELISLVTNINF